MGHAIGMGLDRAHALRASTRTIDLGESLGIRSDALLRVIGIRFGNGSSPSNVGSVHGVESSQGDG